MEGTVKTEVRVVKGVAYHILTYKDGEFSYEREYLLKKFPKKDRSNGAGMRAKAKKLADNAYEQTLSDFMVDCKKEIENYKEEHKERFFFELAKRHSRLSEWQFDFDGIKKLEGEKKAAQAKILKIDKDLLRLKRNAVENSLRTNPEMYGLTKENIDLFINEYLWE